MRWDRKFFPDSPRARTLSRRAGDAITVREVLRRYVDTAERSLQSSTWLDYKRSVDSKLIPAFGDLHLTDLTRAKLREWASGLDVTPKRLANILLPLRAVLKAFYASTTIYIIAGLLAVAGALDKIMVFTEDLPFARNTSRAIVEAKLCLLIGVCIYAYFKFTRALRQFNFLQVLLGAAPQPKTSEAELDAYTSRLGMLNALSASTAASARTTLVSPRSDGWCIPESSSFSRWRSSPSFTDVISAHEHQVCWTSVRSPSPNS